MTRIMVLSILDLILIFMAEPLWGQLAKSAVDSETIEEAMRNITEAATLCLEDEMPTPHAAFVGVRDLEIVA